MSEVLEVKYHEFISMPNNFRENIFYPESHEDDSGESTIHYRLVSDLFRMLIFFSKQSNIFIAANLNLYYEQNQRKRYYTPNAMIAFGVPNYNRKVYKLWEENVFPQVIFEVASETTWKTDIGDKVEDYERLGVEEYHLLDPENAYLPLPLMAYRRDEAGRLRLVRSENDRVLSPLLNLEIVWENEEFRLFDPKAGEFLMTTEEMKTELDRLRAELKKRS